MKYLGGWYDAGDFVKFNFPMSYSTTVLAWGMITFEEGYKIAGEWQNAIDSIKWVTDYLIKCHTGPTEFWGQVRSNQGSVPRRFYQKAAGGKTAFAVAVTEFRQGGFAVKIFGTRV